MAIKVQKTENTGVVYSDPADPGLSIRFKQVEQQKSLNGMPAVNHVTEIIINDDNDVTIGGNTVVDAVSIRVRVSGTALSKVRIKALLGILDGLDAWSDEDVFAGFRPTTTPALTYV